MKGLLVLILLSGYTYCKGQNLNGQWRGSFNSAGNVVAQDNGETEYVLEIEIQGDSVSGYSYSYFNYPQKKYYVICRLGGKYEASSKSVVVNEEERIKGNTPPGWSDCLQTHMLTFLKQGNTEKLVGRWRGFRPNGCGVGSTELERKTLTRVTPPKTTPSVAKKDSPVKEDNKTTLKQNLAAKPKTTAPKTTPKKETTVVKKNTNPPANVTAKKKIAPANANPFQKPEQLNKDSVKQALPEVKAPAIAGYQARNKNILKTIEVEPGQELKLDFYDNGEVDGDVISVFFNNKLILSHQQLTDKPITLNLKLDTDRDDNELVMYADNLGSIPPNTALMIATIGSKRYEVYITSTENSSGTVRFRLKEK